ncbi:hypothetical protein OS493_025207 [Desmophyllum pertusum]|uniref:Uncharacterized protein n=1 Tax=Desmophyllum pertusum TaxID=174260 RepID=A0A9W9ZLF4_9CNID|nr:hypothetical protein OS493_025207 [Desmophyllum pertusum]
MVNVAIMSAGRLSCHQFIIGVILTLMLNRRFGSTKENGSSISVLSRLFSDYDPVMRPGFEG